MHTSRQACITCSRHSRFYSSQGGKKIILRSLVICKCHFHVSPGLQSQSICGSFPNIIFALILSFMHHFPHSFFSLSREQYSFFFLNAFLPTAVIRVSSWTARWGTRRGKIAPATASSGVGCRLDLFASASVLWVRLWEWMECDG